jgi:alpha-L-rhamnosidase
MAMQTDYPSFIDAILNRGNTVMKETWTGGQVQMPSLQGPIGTWFYHSLAGIRTSDEVPGFKRIVIRPETSGTLTWVTASHVTPYGEVKSDWRKIKRGFRLELRIPGNTTAIVFLPATSSSTVKEGGRSLENVSGVSFLRMEDGRAVIQVGAGTYLFESFGLNDF